MKKFLLLPFIFVCLSVQWSMAQAPKWVEKAKRAVFSVVIYDKNDKILNTGNGFFVTENLVKCVARLYDRGKSDPQIKKICLDLWDSLFKCDFKKMKPLSDMIDSFE